MKTLKASAVSASLSAVLALAAPVALAQTNGSKKDLVQRVLQYQQPAIEALAQQLAERPAMLLLQQVGPALQQRVKADKREAVAREIQADARRYVEAAAPVVRESAAKNSASVLAPMLESKLTEDELRQVIQVLQQMETSAFRKYSELGPEMQRALAERVVADSKDAIDPKLRSLQNTVSKRLGIPAATGPASAPAR
jgi:hypothetical protein